MEGMNKKFADCSEAVEAFHLWKPFLTGAQQEKLYNARILEEAGEFQILSGPDLLLDHAGYGPTLTAAIEDYVHIYLNRA